MLSKPIEVWFSSLPLGLTQGRGPHRPEERPRAAMGQARNAAPPARRPALRERLSVRRHLSGPRHRRGPGAALRRHRAMQLHLDEIARTVARGAHAVLLLDRAGWHTTPALAVPKNITMILLPSRAPELNPVENIWQYLRAELALQPRLRHLRGHHRRRLRRLAKAHRPARDHHLDRLTRMGPRQVKGEGRWNESLSSNSVLRFGSRGQDVHLVGHEQQPIPLPI